MSHCVWRMNIGDIKLQKTWNHTFGTNIGSSECFFRKKLTLHNQMTLQKEIKTPIIVCDIYACPFFGARILKWCVLIMGLFHAFSFSKVTWEHKKSYILSPSLTIWLAKGIFWTSSKMSHTKKVWHFKRYCGCFPWSQLLVFLWYLFLGTSYQIEIT